MQDVRHIEVEAARVAGRKMLEAKRWFEAADVLVRLAIKARAEAERKYMEAMEEERAAAMAAGASKEDRHATQDRQAVEEPQRGMVLVREVDRRGP
jgi:hypothetical protein